MAKKLWGGRFSKKTNPLVEEFTKSIQYDCRLALYDVLGSIAHAKILKEAHFLTSAESSKLIQALEAIYKDCQKGLFKPDQNSEDIHTAVQNAVQKKAGAVALKLHMARSRNDQVVFAMKLYCKTQIAVLESDVEKLILSLKELAGKNKGVVIPGFTHMQHAQPVLLKDYLWAYADMLTRDSQRLNYTFENIKLTLGAGALAGTPIDAASYELKASDYLKADKDQQKGFNIDVTSNSLDIVSDRDFIIELLSHFSIMGMHLSRLAEDLIIWSSKEFDFIDCDEGFCTGSSLMPNKKNPDVLELVRGYTGRLYGNLVSVLTTMKGLPLSYNRDMQLDKEPLFSSLDICSQAVKVMQGLIKTLKFNQFKIAESLKDEALYATDVAYLLVDKGVPFKEAHTIVGELVRYSGDNSVKIKDMSDVQLKRFSDKLIKKEVCKLFDPKVSIRSKKSIRRKNA